MKIVTAMSLSGTTTFNPVTDSLTDKDGNLFKLSPPSSADLPSNGFLKGRTTFGYPVASKPDPSVTIVIDEKSDRLQLLESFKPWDGKDFNDLRLLVKISGKCTTDHISAAGPWLKYKGHLENISKNTLIGATNSFTGKVNVIKNFSTGKQDTIPNVCFDYKSKNIPWAIVADFNYGEGSAREHAAMQPRYLGCKLVISRSFARIHETNLKKQGVLPLTFKNPDDYEKITEDSLLSTRGLEQLAPDSSVTLLVQAGDQSFEVPLLHTMSESQIQWFKAGSALNMIASQSQ
jgi:aconitase A